MSSSCDACWSGGGSRGYTPTTRTRSPRQCCRKHCPPTHDAHTNTPTNATCEPSSYIGPNVCGRLNTCRYVFQLFTLSFLCQGKSSSYLCNLYSCMKCAASNCYVNINKPNSCFYVKDMDFNTFKGFRRAQTCKLDKIALQRVT